MKQLILFVFIGLSIVVYAETEEVEGLGIIDRLLRNKCSSFLIPGFDWAESSASVTLSSECSRNYLLDKQDLFTNNELGLYFRLLSASDRKAVINDYFHLILERGDQKFAVNVISEGCILGGKIDWYEESYSQYYNDFSQLKVMLESICE